MSKRNVAESVAGNAAWEMIKLVAKHLLPFIAGFGIREWVTAHTTGLMWAAAVVVAGMIAFWDWRSLPRGRDLSSKMNAKPSLAPGQSCELMPPVSSEHGASLLFSMLGEQAKDLRRAIEKLRNEYRNDETFRPCVMPSVFADATELHRNHIALSVKLEEFARSTEWAYIRIYKGHPAIVSEIKNINSRKNLTALDVEHALIDLQENLELLSKRPD